MTAEEEREIIEWTSDQNLLHMQQSGEIDYIFEWLFRHGDILVDGTTKKQVDEMTRFKRIELLERLSEDSRMFGHEMTREICQFVEEIRPFKDGFRTADDFTC